MRKTNFTLAVCLSIILLSGCQTGNNQKSPAGTSTTESEVTTIASNQESPAASEKYMGINEIFVHRSNGFTEHYKMEDLNTPFEPLIKNINSIYWIAPRGGAGINESGNDYEVKKTSDLPVLQVSTNDKVDLNTTYIRLACDPILPEPGVNETGHQDLIVYQDLDHPADAYFGVQNPKNTEEWTIYKMPDYGMWLSKELDIILRDGYGF